MFGSKESDADTRPESRDPMVTIYTTMFCGYCWRAKKLLGEKGVAFHEIDVTMDPNGRKDMMHRAGGRHTVPQIFIGERHIGGSDELLALEKAGALDALLEEQA